ncbi:gamma-glutamyl-gamma-aminobutyrate hydrolase family protein [Limibacillus halophilus]|uniref:gamma-glutamyl-gamma-aminobutyrate hydrolase n=1 Tax=Limibacillus halophilus TaxID=1579333 RepID=A0A839SPL6_9PROT|nr:gamma-glutamyl-gamma-aminobutyrate hydrolase family protein [Limibacillus halophilus]MBB3063869.1 putative glutamine amidotransferase [Limibacillus halophilus]
MTAKQPLIGVPACVRSMDQMPFHVVGDKYVRAVSLGAKGIPVVFPALGDLIPLAEMIDRLDGIMLTGSPSNVHPTRYGQTPTPEAEPHDEWRDETTLPLIELALEHGVPLFAICRGYQELNVALGGTLYPRVHELEGRLDHRAPKVENMDIKYGPRHSVDLTPGGELEKILGVRRIEINSLHWQAIDQVADRLAIEAIAPDGTYEAVSVKGASTFALGVQWHPEYKVRENPASLKMFEAFGDAARQRAEARAQGRLALAV